MKLKDLLATIASHAKIEVVTADAECAVQATRNDVRLLKYYNYEVISVYADNDINNVALLSVLIRKEEE